MAIAQYILEAVDQVPDLGPIPRLVPAISQPPCPACLNFQPIAIADPTGQLVSVQLCTAPHDQERDFSCFDPK